MIKTTVLLPEDVRENAKSVDVRDRNDVRTVVIEALEQYLKKRREKL